MEEAAKLGQTLPLIQKEKFRNQSKVKLFRAMRHKTCGCGA